MNIFNTDSRMYNVINLKSFKIGRNRSPVIAGKCKHKNIMLDDSTNRIQCQDCEEILDPFWAIRMLITDWSNYHERIKKEIDQLKKLKDDTVVLRAAKHLEKELRRKKTLPTCPHCREALLPEDLFKMGKTSKELAVARRKNQPKAEKY